MRMPFDSRASASAESFSLGAESVAVTSAPLRRRRRAAATPLAPRPTMTAFVMLRFYHAGAWNYARLRDMRAWRAKLVMASASALAIGVAFGLGFGCDGDEVDPALADVVFEGGATDEALTAMLDAKVI